MRHNGQTKKGIPMDMPDDKEQIAIEIKNHWNVTNINHIEVIDDNKSVAFSKTADGTEMEMYLEKSLFSWKEKRDYSFIPEGITNQSTFHFSILLLAMKKNLMLFY